MTKRTELKYDEIDYSGITIKYSWCHAQRRTLHISVRPDRSVVVRVPLRTLISQIRMFVLSKAAWIVKVWKKLATLPTIEKQDYGRGAVFMFQGNEYRLEFTQGLHRNVQLHDDLLIMTCPEIPTEEVVRKTIDGWYRELAHEIVKVRSIECHRLMQKEDIPLPAITIRRMASRWGSYSYTTKRISLNLNLIKAPVSCLDYVIIHELCHIKIRHHGSDFWQMVGRYFPDYVVIRKNLRLYA
jgi:predicted metal-dependent hydrolase